jgi:two-component system, LytTR family, sensor histidine kinase AlgZ
MKTEKPGGVIQSKHFVFWTGWLFFTLVLASLLTSSGGVSWKHALYLGSILSAIAQVSSSSASFSCRTTPLAKTPVWRLIATHLVAALLLTFFWVKIGAIVAHEFDASMGSWSGIDAEYRQKTGMLYGAGVFYYLLSVAFQYALIAQKLSQEAQERALESSLRARDAELSALKAQINPHFLYNSLNSISALTSIDPTRAREMCVLLADFLRMTLGLGEKTVIPLRTELELLEKYCAIEKVRFGARMNMQEEVQEEAKDCLLPPLLLQPLVENAVVHGIAQMPEGGRIRLQAVRNGDRLSLTVENTWDPEAGPSRRNGVGLKNVHRRLEARYGKDAQIQAKAEDDVFRVSMGIPVETETTEKA